MMIFIATPLMSRNILITGGAGFIGSHIADALIARGDHVKILDNFDSQVHHPSLQPYLPLGAEVHTGDVRDPVAVRKALYMVDTVVHCAAAVGVGQSQYEIQHYTDVNVQGTAHLLEAIQETGTVAKVVCCSSMSCYGEGAYKCPTHGLLKRAQRTKKQLIAREWEVACPHCSIIVEPVGITEEQVCEPKSMYALSKKMQEDMILNAAETYGFNAVALRFFNVFGPRQSLHNPYTGVVAIFLANLLRKQKAVLYEDGKQLRDFVAVEDVVDAVLMAADAEQLPEHVFNVGTGIPISIREIFTAVAEGVGLDAEPEVLEQYRIGDVRHCFSDSSLIASVLGWSASIKPLDGIFNLCKNTADADCHAVEDVVNILQKKSLLV